MLKCQFAVLGRTEYHQFADRRNSPSFEHNQDDHIDAQSCETEQTAVLQDYSGSKIFNS